MAIGSTQTNRSAASLCIDMSTEVEIKKTIEYWIITAIRGSIHRLVYLGTALRLHDFLLGPQHHHQSDGSLKYTWSNKVVADNPRPSL